MPLRVENLPLALDMGGLPFDAQLPMGLKPLCFRMVMRPVEGGEIQQTPVLWFTADVNPILVPRKLLWVTSNHQLADDFHERWQYLGSVMYSDEKGVIMFHLFIDYETQVGAVLDTSNM